MRDTIKKHIQFQMPDDSPAAVMSPFVAKCGATKFPGDARYGLIATKRTFKLAAHRNRAKRLLRVWIRENENLMSPNFDYIFIARAPVLQTTKPDGVNIMARALQRLKTDVIA